MKLSKLFVVLMCGLVVFGGSAHAGLKVVEPKQQIIFQGQSLGIVDENAVPEKITTEKPSTTAIEYPNGTLDVLTNADKVNVNAPQATQVNVNAKNLEELNTLTNKPLTQVAPPPVQPIMVQPIVAQVPIPVTRKVVQSMPVKRVSLFTPPPAPAPEKVVEAPAPKSVDEMGLVELVNVPITAKVEEMEFDLPSKTLGYYDNGILVVGSSEAVTHNFLNNLHLTNNQQLAEIKKAEEEKAKAERIKAEAEAKAKLEAERRSTTTTYVVWSYGSCKPAKKKCAKTTYQSGGGSNNWSNWSTNSGNKPASQPNYTKNSGVGARNQADRSAVME